MADFIIVFLLFSAVAAVGLYLAWSLPEWLKAWLGWGVLLDTRRIVLDASTPIATSGNQTVLVDMRLPNRERVVLIRSDAGTGWVYTAMIYENRWYYRTLTNAVAYKMPVLISLGTFDYRDRHYQKVGSFQVYAAEHPDYVRTAATITLKPDPVALWSA